ncbi:MAG: hypothetical protein IKZ58_05445 [Selenomonadaceae bacterium]|nr:hypothetical protein [Selenomonadaceae bacterium]
MFGKSKIFVALAFIFTLIFSTTTAFADTSGSTNTATINVATGTGFFKPYIVLSQNKAQASFHVGTKDKAGTLYGHYNIVVKKDGRQVNNFTWKNGSTKIKLDRNANYTITVSFINGRNGDPRLEYSSGMYHFNHWIEQPQWRVSKESKIESCW